MVCSGTICSRPVMSLTISVHSRAFVPPPTADDPPDRSTGVFEVLQDLANAETDALVGSPEQVPASMHASSGNQPAGVRSQTVRASPAKYGSSRPGRTAAADGSVSKGVSPNNRCNQVVRLPEVDIPAASVSEPGTHPAVVHSLGSARSCPKHRKNMVEPYISMRMPDAGVRPLGQASTIPAQTGTPAGSPVAWAAPACTVPDTWPRRRRAGAGQMAGDGGVAAGVPLVVPQVVERIALVGSVVVLAPNGWPGDVGAEAVPPPGPGKQLGLVVAQPSDLGADSRL